MKTATSLKERPFEYLKRKDNAQSFPEEIVKNWYIARAFVLKTLKDISFVPDSAEHLDIVIDGDSPLMLAVLRQVALSAHYINFVEYDIYGHLVCKNRSVITLVTQKSPSEIVRELKKEENLCNLLDFCKYSLFGEVRNKSSYLDLELHIVETCPGNTMSLQISENDVCAFVQSNDADDIFTIDTRKAICSKRAYTLGAVIDNLPYEDIFCAGRYSKALATFEYSVLQDNTDQKLVSADWADNLMSVKNGISNILCSDCFESRELAINKQHKDYLSLNEDQRCALWEKNHGALSLSEHCRWVVEKLIFGFSPLSFQQRIEYESIFGKKRTAFAYDLKNNSQSPSHIDLCSFRDLRRIDPDNMKYDSFLMLAIPYILDKIREEDSHVKKSNIFSDR